MHKVWNDIIQQNKIKNAYKKKRRKFTKKIFKIGMILLCLHLLFPQYGRRIFYPYLYGKPTDQTLRISETDSFEDISAPSFQFQRGKMSYILEPRTKYSVTGRIGIIEHYDTLRNLIFRGQFQGDYINLVPRDMMFVIGQMAQEDIFKKFRFGHEERMGKVLCKGVEYQTSFMPSFMSKKKAAENWKKYQECQKYMRTADYNNYHPIPANERINKALSMLLPNDVVYIEGILVDVPAMGLNTGTRKEQSHKNMTVNGYAPGMCFILYTTKVIFNNRIYE